MLDCFLRQNAGLYTIWVVLSLNKREIRGTVWISSVCIYAEEERRRRKANKGKIRKLKYRKEKTLNLYRKGHGK